MHVQFGAAGARRVHVQFGVRVHVQFGAARARRVHVQFGVRVHVQFGVVDALWDQRCSLV